MAPIPRIMFVTEAIPLVKPMVLTWQQPADPDYSPSGTSFGLQWGPWLKRGERKTSFLSYVTKNYVGFREITLTGGGKPMETPQINIPEADSNGVCLHLAPDAFLKWEDHVGGTVYAAIVPWTDLKPGLDH